jgi:trk system potassium uptake protein
MFLSIPVSLIFKEGDHLSFIYAGSITVLTGGLAWYFSRNAPKDFFRREGYIIVVSGWVLFSLFGTLPFVLTGSIPSFTDAFFETMSGFTTTGASILDDIESLSHGVLFWRSLTQWIGGMGIIVLSLAILPLLGIGGMQLFVAEVPGVTYDKLHPRIKGTAARLWFIYIIFTFSEAILLAIGGMEIFDAVCHSFTTMATGGYSTKQASIGHWDSPFIQYVIIFFMILAGTNFTLSYFALHLRFDKISRNEEFRYYISFILLFTVIIGLGLFLSMDMNAEQSFRISLFQVVSIMTTTGYVTSDYLSWIPVLGVIVFFLMFFGGSAGSTGGGVKIMRVVLLLKNSALELKRLIHPNAVVPVRYNQQLIDPQIITNVLAFVSYYLIILAVSMLLMSALGYDLDTSLGAVATCLGNIGPGIGEVGPMSTFNHVPDFGKWFLSFLMLVGRLELFTVLVLFSRTFWRD